MAVFNIDLQKQPIYLPTQDGKAVLKEENNYQNVKVLDAKEITDKSQATNHAIFMPLQFDPVEYEDINGGTVSLDGLYIPLAICEFTLSKNIKKTTLAGQKFTGTVKEQVCIGDWEVSIKAMLIGEGTLYPEEDLRKLYRYAMCPKEIGVTHDICKMLGIYYLVLEQPQLTNKQGFQNVQPFNISACSDNPVELKLNKN